MKITDPYHFTHLGRSCHLSIKTANDLLKAITLDQSHWVATSAPVTTFNCDPVFLDLLDDDCNGRIMSYELITSIQWLLDVLSDTAGVSEKSDELALTSVNADNDHGKKILTASQNILGRLDDTDGRIDLGQVRQFKTKIEKMPVSEAGIVLPEAGSEAVIHDLITDIIATVGGDAHPGNALGVGIEKLKTFTTQANNFLKWQKRGLIAKNADSNDIMPLGIDTPQAYETFAAMRDKLDQYFAQCHLLSLDETYAAKIDQADNLADADLLQPADIKRVMANAVIAKADSDQKLDFAGRVNPYYADMLEMFKTKVFWPIIDRYGKIMTAEQWKQIKATLAGHDAWVTSKPATSVEVLGADKLEKYVDSQCFDSLAKLIADSNETAIELGNVRLVEKLILFQVHMIDFANNFVSFPYLYDPASRAMFELGSLVMDGRRFNMAIRVENRKEHVKMIDGSNMFVMYVEIAPLDGEKGFEAAIPVTAGDKGNLCVGKRGVFHGVNDKEYDAKVVHIVENPISLREALASPFVRMGRLVTGKIESFTADAEKKLEAKTSNAIDSVAAAKPAAGPAAGNMLMGASVAIAALSSALAYTAKTLTSNPWVILGVFGVVLLTMVPVSLVAFMKLRKRDLSSILEGSGWGINARMRLTNRQGKFFSQKPKFPVNSIGAGRLPLVKIFVIAVVLAGLVVGGFFLKQSGKLNSFLKSDTETKQVK